MIIHLESSVAAFSRMKLLLYYGKLTEIAGFKILKVEPKADPYQFDAKYIERLKERDPDIETHFAHYFGERLRARLLHRGFAIATAEDISQETFLRVLAAVKNETVKYPDRFGAYVSSVCDNVVLEKYREHARHRHLDVDAIDQPDPKTVDLTLLHKLQDAALIKSFSDLMQIPEKEVTLSVRRAIKRVVKGRRR
jgi:DNA-directed RNA polymerase specialized sigma24 family protein